MASAVFLDRIPVSQRWGAWLNWLKSAGIITDAQVAANPTVTGLVTAMRTGAARTDQQPMVVRAKLALDKAIGMGQVPETHGQTTVAGLVALGDGNTTRKSGYID